MSPVCHNFVQNAWKKDFCSNCFKSRDEHVKLEKPNECAPRVISTFTSKSAVVATKVNKNPTGILKQHTKRKSKRCVKFTEQISSVIGYGGDGWSDEEEFEMSEDVEDDDIFPDTEEEKEMYKITKSNTDFNTVKANLLGDNKAKSYTSLMLGKTQTDSDGKKKTLLVSVTPFGQDNVKGKIKSQVNQTSLVTNSYETVTNGQKTNITSSSYVSTNETIINSKYESTETISRSICSGKSLLDEISETLGTELNVKSQKEKPIIVNEQIKEDCLTLQEKKDALECKKNGLMRNSPIVKNQERPKVTLSNRLDFKLSKSNAENDSIDSAVSTLSSNGADLTNSDEESVCAPSDIDNEDSGNFSENNKIDDDKAAVNKEVIQTLNKTMGDIRKADGQSDVVKPSFYISNYPSKILDMPPIIPKISSPDIFSAEASRELAGEPDGRADPDDSSEAPALPNSPIPTMIDAQPSFLQGLITEMPARPAIAEKPKVPLKPVAVLKQQTTKINKTILTKNQQYLSETHQLVIETDKEINKMAEQCSIEQEKYNEITEIKEEKAETIYSARPVIAKYDSDNTLNKRKAPMPPDSPIIDDTNSTKYQRNIHSIYKSDAPVVREMEKRERASSITKIDQNAEVVQTNPQPEPAPRRNISLSHDNLLIEEKRKGKMKFSIKRFLRLGNAKELEKKEFTGAVLNKVSSKPIEEIYDMIPKPKPRLVIIHPSDLNGSDVEVVKANFDIPESVKRLSHDDLSSIYSGSSSVQDLDMIHPKVVSKPPPPPRTVSDESKTNDNVNTAKPIRPPPPKSAVLQKKQKSYTWTSSSGSPHKDNIYANLGDIRSSIAPKKPERTASMREREARLEVTVRRTNSQDLNEPDEITPEPIVQARNETVIHNYDDVYNSEKYERSSLEDNNSGKNSDSDYEYVNHARSSSPECDSNANRNIGEIKKNNFDATKTEYRKISPEIFNRCSSITYCGSETESEIYSPYSFYADLDGSVCNGDFGGDIKNTTNKLRVRKGRSIVHKNLEDNYGAVVIANHEALAQVLEQVQQSLVISAPLRGIKACTNLRWNDFTLTVTQKNQIVKTGKRIFAPAVWNSNTLGAVNVTLMICKEQTASQIYSQQTIQPQTLSLNAITEFCDLVPLEPFGESGTDSIQATVAVLAPSQVDTIQSFGANLYSSDNSDNKDQNRTEQIHEATFVMLQLVKGLKYLQSRGIEEIPSSLTSFIILKDTQQATVIQGSTLNLQSTVNDLMPVIQAPKTNGYGRLCILQGLSENSKFPQESLTSLCECAISAVDILLPSQKLSTLLKDLLKNERSVSLSQAKNVIEFTLWGPLEVVQSVPIKERELSLQRWLDLERATVLHGLVRTRINLNAFEQLHLMFLVRSSAKAVCDASVLLEKTNVNF